MLQQRKNEGVILELPRWNIEKDKEAPANVDGAGDEDNRKTNLRLGGWHIKRREDPFAIRLPQQKKKKASTATAADTNAEDTDDDLDVADGPTGQSKKERERAMQERERRRKEEKFEKVLDKVVQRYQAMEK